ncbi:hypothetical protein XH96_19945 [Bradyrhizobium sp. CCBAU 51765]|nr:hypothetical protein XH96_19945 [Bradyrhizobium sp. CCBAU 51765]
MFQRPGSIPQQSVPILQVQSFISFPRRPVRPLRNWLQVNVIIVYYAAICGEHSENGLILRHARLAVSFRRGPMFKGLTAAVVALISTAQLDRYLTNGRYTDAATDVLRQIRFAFGF